MTIILLTGTFRLLQFRFFMQFEYVASYVHCRKKGRQEDALTALDQLDQELEVALVREECTSLHCTHLSVPTYES